MIIAIAIIHIAYYHSITLPRTVMIYLEGISHMMISASLTGFVNVADLYVYILCNHFI